MIIYKQAQTREEFKQILKIQSKNLTITISSEEKKTEGFVTVHHDLGILEKMNNACGHIIATSNDEVIGYALCMHPKFKEEIDILKPMFSEIDKHQMSSQPYMVMGQICISKEYRKKGVFRGLYNYMSKVLARDYKWIITEVDRSNQRSLNAHLAIGFELISSYRSDGKDWELITMKITD